MANEDDKTIMENDRNKDAADDKKNKKGGNKLILFGGVGVGIIIIGVALAMFVIKPMMAPANEGNKGNESAQVAKKGKDNKKKKGSEEGSIIYTIKNIVVNPAGTGGSRFLSVSFGFELESPELEQEFSQKEPIIRDALITILSSRTVAQLTDPKQKEIVRYQIKKRVSQLMDTDGLDGVYYTDFVLQ
ncbi:MAG: flagellar basal body-associated FliL family protein [FCB group bacterium]|nr:flagellar basal body-associated FliL family protein [FCB group bacterium]